MKLIEIAIILLLSICHAAFDPYQIGEHSVVKKTISKWDLSHDLHVWSPAKQGQNFPLVYALTGFAGKCLASSPMIT